jgi:hypothetical protein
MARGSFLDHAQTGLEAVAISEMAGMEKRGGFDENEKLLLCQI